MRFFFLQHDDDTPLFVFVGSDHHPFLRFWDDLGELAGDYRYDSWKQLLKDMANGA